MIRSMTAFAAVEQATAWGTLTCELRAVNHRFLELGIRLPEELRLIEPGVREQVSARLARGKVDVGFRLNGGGARGGELRLNPLMVERLGHIARELTVQMPALRIEMTELLRFPGVLDESRPDQGALCEAALTLLDQCLLQFVQAREREGEKLAQGMLERIDAIGSNVARVRQWMPQIREALQKRLRARLAEFSEASDSGRIEQELILGLQKLDVDEELDRLDSHLDEARRILGLREAVGRRLDFLLQEFNREANTLGSKSVDARTSQIAVDLKVLIEQLREQVQNIE
ncbi:MAG: YicC family protein [Lysobacterales bacterium CG17_big_fil_post_rev_8_21_14_2_50_64_11]|nr:MAG: YicC family protein [Xanthomonadales bacterium CG17_big_fil_post_rev_8_21_14_2_50_64_11]PIX59475.1 MAG: YicC family protein [Xanthomonadales bacterium CG_4_10_14_3_um_filter_64_11]